MGAAVNGERMRQRVSWHLACGLNRVEWQHTAAMGLLALWVMLIGTIDYPLHTETRRVRLQLASRLALEPARPRSAVQQLAPRDLGREFAAALPEFEKYPEQLRALNLLADKHGVVVSIDYRYEQMPALPIAKLALRMDVRGDEVQQRSFLQTTLNTFSNLSVARLAYAKRTDGVATIEQKLEINLFYRSRPKDAA